MIRKIEIDRFSLTSSKPFDQLWQPLTRLSVIQIWLNLRDQLTRRALLTS